MNQTLHDDIIKLRELHKSDKSGYKKLFNEIIQKHSLSTASVYRELKKAKPGTYRKSVHKPNMVKISKRELDRLTELIVSKKTEPEILSEMSRFKHFSYSGARLARARMKLQIEADMINNPKPKIVQHFYSPKTIDGLKISGVSFIRPDGKEGLPPKNPNLPKFTGDASKLFYELANIDPETPEVIHKIEFGGTVHYVHTSVIKECLDHIAASSVSGGGTISTSLKFTLETLLRGQLDKARRRGYLTSGELKQFTSVQKNLLSFEKETKPKGGNYSFDEVMHIVAFFSPSATREKVAGIITSHPFLNREAPAPILDQNSPLERGGCAAPLVRDRRGVLESGADA